MKIIREFLGSIRNYHTVELHAHKKAWTGGGGGESFYKLKV